MNKSKYIIIFLAALLAISSCTHKFDEYNRNPNQIEVGNIVPSSMMKSLIYYSADIFLNRTWLLNGELMQYTVSASNNTAYHRYTIQSGVSVAVWKDLAEWASNANEMYGLAVKEENENYQAVALTMKVLLMSNITDSFGDMPYSQAFGISGGSHQPAYDTQEEIYRQMFSELELANSLYNPGIELVPTDVDLLYGGQTAKWQKFTNSLYLRLLMRLSNRDNLMGISEKITEIINNPSKYPIFTSNGDNAKLEYTGVNPFSNRFSEVSETTFNGRRMGKFFIDYMKELGDPRIQWFAYRGNNAAYNGVESGMPIDDTDLTGASVLLKTVLGTGTSPYCLMKYDEIQFILAEAAHRGMIPGGQAAADSYYTRGIRSSIDYWDSVPAEGKLPVSESTITLFMNNIPYNGSLENIMNQKYVAMFWVGLETWYDYRRTGYPLLKIGSGVGNNGVLPTRFPYPVNSERTNKAHYDEAVARMARDYENGADNMRTPVWWSKLAQEIGQ